MLLNLFRRAGDPYMLVLGMTGVKLGERVVQLGCAHGGRLAAIAKRVGLSGRAVAIVPDEASETRARKGSTQAGVLVEIETASPTRVPVDDAAFDLVVIDDTAGLLGTMSTLDQAKTVRESLRILRPGGRVMVFGTSPRSGIARLLARSGGGAAFDPQPLLQTGGFRSVRRLAEREGLVFVEGVKQRLDA